MKVPRERRTHRPPASGPGAEIVLNQVAPGSSTRGNGGSYAVALRIAGSVPSRFRRSSSSRSSFGKRSTPKARSIVNRGSPTSQLTLETFRTETAADQPSVVTANDRTLKTSAGCFAG